MLLSSHPHIEPRSDHEFRDLHYMIGYERRARLRMNVEKPRSCDDMNSIQPQHVAKWPRFLAEYSCVLWFAEYSIHIAIQLPLYTALTITRNKYTMISATAYIQVRSLRSGTETVMHRHDL